MRISIFFAFIMTLGLTGCKDEFDLELKQSDKSLLVVEGILNAGQGSTNIRLTQSVNLTDPAQIKPVLQAKVSVEGSNGDSYPFSETGNGNYLHSQLPLVYGQEYRLRIQALGKEYLSDYVVARKTPEIDSVTWERIPDGLHVKASTHDASNNTRYYKWDYDETWEIRSYYTAFYQYLGGTTIVPTSFPYNYRCWKYGISNTINIATTAQLQSDVLTEMPIQFIPLGSEKLSYRYSILLRQQSITKSAYEYFQLMKKNTESIGTIFDPQPSELKGNIRCLTDPMEGVIGYLTASNISQKRIFISAIEADWDYSPYCPSIDVKNHPDSIASWVPSYLPYGARELQPGVVDYYQMGPATCVDCTKRGGDLTMPSYW
jgi:hypothetical protein